MYHFVRRTHSATSTDIVEKIDNILENQPKPLIVEVGTNDLNNDLNLLNNVKKNSYQNENEITQYSSNVFKYNSSKR